MDINLDTSTADLGTSTQVITTKIGGKTVTTTKTTRELGDNRKRKRKRGDGMPPIANEDDLRAALQDHAEAPDTKLRQHITRRAYSIGAAHLIPKEWRDMQLEQPNKLRLDLALATVGADVKPEILAEDYDPTLPRPAEGVMRIRVPFYVGESTVKIGGFSAPLHFPSDALPGIVAEGNRQIAAGDRPNLTTYARHAHAESAEHLPIGGVIKLEQQGPVGYGIIDIAPAGLGKDVQTLIRAGLLNAVSLRASDYEDLEKVKINGEPALTARIRRIEGIDFAPDGPAMPTFGVQRLAAEASVEPVIDPEPEEDEESEPTPSEEEVVDFSTLTLEQIKAERPDLFKAIESPLSSKVTELETENASVKEANKVLAEKVNKVEISAEVAKVAAMFPDAAAALPIVAEACKDCKSALEVSAVALPLVAEAFKTAGVKPKVEAESEKTPAQKLALQLAPATGQVITAESAEDEDVEKYGGMRVPNR